MTDATIGSMTEVTTAPPDAYIEIEIEGVSYKIKLTNLAALIDLTNTRVPSPDAREFRIGVDNDTALTTTEV